MLRRLYLPRFQGVCFAMLRFQGFFGGWVLELHVLLPLFFGMVAVALPCLGSIR